MPISPNTGQLGRPKSQKQIVAQNFRAILQDVAKGNALLQTLEKLGVHWNAFYAVLQSSPKRREAYARARESCVAQWIDQIVPMSDNVIGEEMNVVTATRNAVDARKWIASKLMPREYGDAPTGVTINNTQNVVVVSEERLRQLQETRRRMIEQQKGG